MSNDTNEAMLPRAIFIGPAAIGDTLEKLRPKWEFLPHVPDIATFRAGLADGSIDNYIQVLLIVDRFFDPHANDTSFEKLIARLSPYCMLGIISYSPENQGPILNQIEHERYSGSFPDGQIFFIDKNRPNKSLDTAVNTFVANAESEAEEAAAILSGRKYTPLEKADVDSSEPIAPATEALAQTVKSDKLGQVVAVTSSKGGSGKSTVSITLATYLAHASINSVKEGLQKKPLKIVLLDLDVRDGQVGFFTGFIQPTVLKLKRFGISEESIKDTIIHDDGLKIDVLLAPRRPRASEEVPPDFYVELIQHLKGMYDYVILDTSVNYLDPLLERVAYPMADQIVMVTEIVTTSIFSMARWIQEVTSPIERNGMNIPKRKIGIVVNKTLSDVNMHGEKIVENAQGVPIITVVPSNQKLIAHATNVNSMEVLLEHKDLRSAFARLAKAIVGKKYKLSENVV